MYVPSFPTNGVISYSDQTLGLNTAATYTCNIGYMLSLETPSGLVGVMECGVDQLQLVKVLKLDRDTCISVLTWGIILML